MILTMQTQVQPAAKPEEELEETLRVFNAAADWLAGEAFDRELANKIDLQKLYYKELRSRFGLSAQMAIRCIAQVCDVYKRDKTKRPHFRPLAAMPFDQRMMSFKGEDAVSLLTMKGRVIVPWVKGAYQAERLRAERGQCDLMKRKDGKWLLQVSVDSPEEPLRPIEDFIGVDMGVVNLAVDSNGDCYSGADVEACRVRHHNRRKDLQKAAAGRKRRGKRPKNIRRKLKASASAEKNYRKNTNHIISKKLVAKAKDTGCGIAGEDLQGIRDRQRFRRQHRARMGGWGFHQLRSFIEYKAKLAGVAVVFVDPRNTSRECAECGHTEKANRPSQEKFCCRGCGHTDLADRNAARNIRARARALVNAPIVSDPRRRRRLWRSTGTSF